MYGNAFNVLLSKNDPQFRLQIASNFKKNNSAIYVTLLTNAGFNLLEVLEKSDIKSIFSSLRNQLDKPIDHERSHVLSLLTTILEQYPDIAITMPIDCSYQSLRFEPFIEVFNIDKLITIGANTSNSIKEKQFEAKAYMELCLSHTSNLKKSCFNKG